VHDRRQRRQRRMCVLVTHGFLRLGLEADSAVLGLVLVLLRELRTNRRCHRCKSRRSGLPQYPLQFGSCDSVKEAVLGARHLLEWIISHHDVVELGFLFFFALDSRSRGANQGNRLLPMWRQSGSTFL
jgi:hypothetical protein